VTASPLRIAINARTNFDKLMAVGFVRRPCLGGCGRVSGYQRNGGQGADAMPLRGP
jgi:hypothetical protein